MNLREHASFIKLYVGNNSGQKPRLFSDEKTPSVHIKASQVALKEILWLSGEVPLQTKGIVSYSETKEFKTPLYVPDEDGNDDAGAGGLTPGDEI